MRIPGEILSDLLSSLSQAAGGASQMIHHHKDPRWIILDKTITAAREGIIHFATATKG